MTRTIFVRNMYDCAINFYDLAFICDKKVHRQNIFHYNFIVTHYMLISRKNIRKRYMHQYLRNTPLNLAFVMIFDLLMIWHHNFEHLIYLQCFAIENSNFSLTLSLIQKMKTLIISEVKINFMIITVIYQNMVSNKSNTIYD